MNRCRSCKKPILWTRTANGHNHPLDYEPVPDGPWVIENDVMHPYVEGPALLETPEPTTRTLRYTSHFATCEYADRHRRPK